MAIVVSIGLSMLGGTADIMPAKPSNFYFGPSGVHALPLAAGINVVAIVLVIIFLSSSLFSLSESLTFLPEIKS